MLSAKVKYAIKALLYLGENESNRYVLSRDVAEAKSIPKKFLDAIFLELKEGGLLYSKKGRGGGYGLIRPVAEIMIGQVIGSLEGPPARLPCGRQPAEYPCSDGPTCRICHVDLQVREATAEILNSTSLLDLAAGPNAHILTYDI